MHDLSLSEKQFQNAMRAANARGFGSVEAYFEDVVREDLAALKTPPYVLDKIDAGLADLNAGNSATLPAVETFLARRRADWIDERAG